MECIKCGIELQEGSVFCHMCGRKQVTERRHKLRANGEGTVFKRGKTWTAAVVLGYKLVNGKSVPIRPTKGGFKTKKEALEYLPILKQERKKAAPTLYALWQQFKESKKFQKLSDSRQEKYNIAWKKIEPSTFVRIDLLTVRDLQIMVDDNATTYYTARDIKDLLSKLYQLAMPDEFVTNNLAEFIELPELKEKGQEAFPKEDVTRLWEDYAAGNWWTGYILLMIYTGMMPGELLAALKSQIDWSGNKIEGAGKKTKERKSKPIVLANFIMPVLADLCEHTSGDKLIKINKDNFYDKYYATLERAGCKRIPPYSCRHTAATTLALENIPPSVIQGIMRHAKFTSTERYIHVDINPMLDAVNRLPSRQKCQ